MSLPVSFTLFSILNFLSSLLHFLRISFVHFFLSFTYVLEEAFSPSPYSSCTHPSHYLSLFVLLFHFSNCFAIYFSTALLHFLPSFISFNFYICMSHTFYVTVCISFLLVYLFFPFVFCFLFIFLSIPSQFTFLSIYCPSFFASQSLVLLNSYRLHVSSKVTCSVVTDFVLFSFRNIHLEFSPPPSISFLFSVAHRCTVRLSNEGSLPVGVLTTHDYLAVSLPVSSPCTSHVVY